MDPSAEEPAEHARQTFTETLAASEQMAAGTAAPAERSAVLARVY